MLGVVCDHASSGLVMRVLRALEEAVEKREDDIQLLEAIVICLTKMAALLDKVCTCTYTYMPCHRLQMMLG